MNPKVDYINFFLKSNFSYEFFFQAVWKDALQTKFKRKRLEHRDNIEVQHYQIKYSRVGSGRPVKKGLVKLLKKINRNK